MTQTSQIFQSAIAWLLPEEGGLTNDPDDPGGLTKYGIDQRSHPGVDIKNLTKDQAVQIYWDSYWIKSKCDQLPDAVAFIHFDASVNEGLGAAAKFLQEAVNVTVDGSIGPKTLAAVRKANTGALLIEYAARRGTQYGNLGTFAKFGLGWMRRLMSCLAVALTHV